MPPEMLRIESGSAMTASAMMSLAGFLASPDTAGTATKNLEAEQVALRSAFWHGSSFFSPRGIIAELDTVVENPSLGRLSAVSAAPQKGFRERQIVSQPRQEQAAPVAGQEQSFSSQETKARVGAVSPSLTTVETISPEAAQRFSGHEGIVQKVCSFAKEEAQARGLAILKIDVRPAWSHEYDERTGIVIDVEIRASSDERFSYWDAVCERLSRLEDLLPPQEQRFLQDQAFFVVNEG